MLILFINLFFTGTWVIKDIRPNPEGKSQKVKVKVRVNLHGIMTISSASMYEAKESPESEIAEEPQQKDAQQKSTDQQNDTGDIPMDTNNSGAAAPEVGSGSSWTKKISAWFSGVRILSRQRWPGNFVIRSTVFVLVLFFPQRSCEAVYEFCQKFKFCLQIKSRMSHCIEIDVEKI